VLAPGEILVAPVTDVAWTPMFLHAAGLVVEVGGPLSHGSIVAREFGIPAVTAVAGATRRIRSGDRVRVDGSRGVVAVVGGG
jgi:pyruvate,water dikinase